MHRREFIIGASAAAALQLIVNAEAQGLRPVRLMIVRRIVPVPSSDCANRCTRGRIYDVSDLGGAALDTTILPLLAARKPICDTIERPWKNNLPSQSAIPPGSYPAKIRTDESKPWMVGNIDRAWRLELSDVPHRTAIQFHYGQDQTWSEGCFILGSLLATGAGIGDATYCKLENGEAAVAALRATVTAPGGDSQNIRVGVCNDAGLFPNYQPAAQCP